MNSRIKWQCEVCSALLGIKELERIEMVYKEMQIVFCGDGTITTLCRRCKRLNSTRVA